MEYYATGVQHIGIPTTCMEATKEFYGKLGFSVAYETVNDGAQVLFLQLGNLVIETYEGDTRLSSGAIDHIAIDVADVEQTYRVICGMGLNTLQDEIHFLPFWEKGTRFFTIQGPNGERIEFSQIL